MGVHRHHHKLGSSTTDMITLKETLTWDAGICLYTPGDHEIWMDIACQSLSLPHTLGLDYHSAIAQRDLPPKRVDAPSTRMALIDCIHYNLSGSLPTKIMVNECFYIQNSPETLTLTFLEHASGRRKTLAVTLLGIEEMWTVYFHVVLSTGLSWDYASSLSCSVNMIPAIKADSFDLLKSHDER